MLPAADPPLLGCEDVAESSVFSWLFFPLISASRNWHVAHFSCDTLNACVTLLDCVIPKLHIVPTWSHSSFDFIEVGNMCYEEKSMVEKLHF